MPSAVVGLEVEATPEQLARFRELRQRREELELARSHVGRWYCEKPGCNGDPHEGYHWCKHPLSGPHSWECRHARADQRPPAVFVSGEARVWLLMAGRGFGKTRAGAEWILDQAFKHPKTHWGVVARTKDDLKETCFEGESGLLRALGWKREDHRYNKTTLLLRLPNGSLIHSYSSEEPASAHGPNLAGAWLDEIGKWKSREAWDSLTFAVRRGSAQIVATTTPVASVLVREFAKRKDGSVVITAGTTFDNERNLSPAFIAEQRVRWEGTRLGRRELHGELLEDVPGALWNATTIEAGRAVLID